MCEETLQVHALISKTKRIKSSHKWNLYIEWIGETSRINIGKYKHRHHQSIVRRGASW